MAPGLSRRNGLRTARFAGLTASNPFWSLTLGIAMFVGRFFMIFPRSPSPARSPPRSHPEGAGSFPTTGALWVGLLVGLILILGGLTFLPCLALGPVAEQLAMIHGQLF